MKSGFRSVKTFYDNMSDVPDDRVWSGYHQNMLVVSGVVDHTRVPEHVRRHINVG
jgi:hypothetical protein